jgi:hypothetical protein
MPVVRRQLRFRAQKGAEVLLDGLLEALAVVAALASA